ncbi:MAG: hypothetical protein JSS65_06090 [Armatimonadetes bacterium]|nr:hypothetical protein [Armatimonadota bacterium]
MNRAQQALVGSLAGALAVLSLHPVTRPYLLRPLTDPPSLIETATLPLDTDTRSYFLFRRAFGDKSLSTDDFLSIAEASQKMSETDKLNAVWPVLEAWAQDKLDNQEAAESAWRRASQRTRWFDVKPVAIAPTDSAWDRYRQIADLGPGWVQAYSGYVKRLSLADPGEDAARAESVAIGLTAWRSVTSVAGKSLLGQSLRQAVRYDPVKRKGDSVVLETMRQRLSDEQVSDLMSAVASPDREAGSQAIFAWKALAAQRLAGGSMLAGAAGAVLFVVGSLLATWGRARQILALPWCAVLGVASGVAVYLGTGLLFPALWAVVVWGGFAYVRDRIWKGDLADFGRSAQAVTTLLALSFVIAVSVAVIAGEPWARAIHDGTRFGQEVGRTSTLATALAWFLLSLVAVAGQVFAYVRRRTPAVVAARMVRSFGLRAMVCGLVASVVLTPICLAWDTRLCHALAAGEMWDDK